MDLCHGAFPTPRWERGPPNVRPTGLGGPRGGRYQDHERTRAGKGGPAEGEGRAGGGIPLSKPRTFGRTQMPAGGGGTTNVAEMLAVGAKDPAQAHAVLEAFFEEMGVENESRPPLLLAIDSLPALLSTTSYTSLTNEPLPSTHLSLVRPFLNPFLGKTTLHNAVLIGADNGSESLVQSPTLKSLLASAPIINAKDAQTTVSAAPPRKSSPYDPAMVLARVPDPTKVVGLHSPKMDAVAKEVKEIPGLVRFEVPVLSRQEVEGLLRYYIDAKVMRQQGGGGVTLGQELVV
ncbi:hypothetical protein HDU93_009931 [Gonapodya sp. JEL0774]|nr:hypothetical protein HDU93_009931 [Gonapodya sp. JEL0774]